MTCQANAAHDWQAKRDVLVSWAFFVKLVHLYSYSHLQVPGLCVQHPGQH